MNDVTHHLADMGGSEDLHQMSICMQIGEALNKHYPNHLWAVSWQGGAAVVKNLAISAHYGFVLDPQKFATSSEMEKAVIGAGGELLERAKMIRGKWEGMFAETLEGSDRRFFQGTPGQ
jgi:hypothetical protein